MRVRRKPLLALVAGAIALFLGVVWNRSPSELSNVRIELLGYGNSSNAGVSVAPSSNGILAELSLKNNARASIRYAPGSEPCQPYGWVTARTSAGWIRAQTGPPSTNLFNLVRPGSNITFAVLLPAGTLEWKCGFFLRSASIRERAAIKMHDMNLWSRFGVVCRYLIRVFPHHPAPEKEFETEVFEVPRHNEAGAEDGGIPVLLQIGRARPAASDPQS